MIGSPKLQLRKYQNDVVNAIGNENVIIKMETGSGKTFVAAEFIKRGMRYDEGKLEPRSKRKAALFLVPACDLVAQQKKALKCWIGDCDVAEYMGGISCPAARFDVLVSTPQAFLVSKKVDSKGHIFPYLTDNILYMDLFSVDAAAN
jgi:superfamily II DNA or RNA helicase